MAQNQWKAGDVSALKLDNRDPSSFLGSTSKNI
jgi:hypothetical protein